MDGQNDRAGERGSGGAGDQPLPHSTGAAAVAREGQTFDGASLLSRYASFVKLPHTLFALPFAGVGAILASYTHPSGVTWASIGWILVAFTAARFAAMGFNRIVDKHYDALNPRTQGRELPSGRLTTSQAAVSVAVAAAVFVLAAWQLNPLCGWLAPLALAWTLFYSYTKRFTRWAHNVLGLSLGIAPVGAYLAVAGTWSQPWYALVLLAAAVMFWVAGFDIIYALQDVDFDRSHGLHSLPSRSGVRRSLLLARLFHAASVLLFLGIGVTRRFPVHWLFLAGGAIMAVVLHLEHAMLRRQDPERLDLRVVDRAFFQANTVISVSFFLLTLLDRLLLG